MKRILVLRGGALGDFIVTIPAVRLLRRRWPEAKLELVGNARAAEPACVTGLLDAAHSQQEGRWSQLYGTAPLTPELSAWFDDFDLVISFWPDPDGALARHFAHRGADFIRSDAAITSTPAAAHFCAALAPLGLATSDYRPRLEMPAEFHEEVERRLAGLQHFVAIHPGSGSPTKNWPRERWSDLLGRLKRPVLIVTGEADRDVPFWPENLTVQRAQEWPLTVLAAALSRCAVFVGHDSGVSHLAAAIGARTVTLFGPTDPAIWAPPGAHVVQRGVDLNAIAVNDVVAAINAAPTPASASR